MIIINLKAEVSILGKIKQDPKCNLQDMDLRLKYAYKW